MSRVLIAEDEDRIASFVAKGLRASGFTPTVVSDGAKALTYALGDEFDLLVLDLGLPLLDGLQVLADLRAAGTAIPIVILTARSSVADTVAGFDCGADDYISKPFRFEDLLTRIRLRLRGDRSAEVMVLRYQDLVLDLRTRRAAVGPRVVELTARESVLVEAFLRSRGKVLSREQLLTQVWGADFDSGSNLVDVYVGYLRRKLGPERIETVRGLGYRLWHQPLPETTTGAGAR
ncbi:DNA-binding response OmpR family regulator [Kribbella sp. VKM Ac-2527]|uniref:DNA-binding response OmpR family regulator n=1 Tax=Kribbella caucasensis TaxID=2512215 RepID=A0A4R6KAY8_9ACTN|nr:response regulator transcription factor [Kribbella sp. VKM Ac-2527]TDO47235.1 DNA-binding response OmpR family regulator [Kribbella sp. VKM Ac-2527]